MADFLYFGEIGQEVASLGFEFEYSFADVFGDGVVFVYEGRDSLIEGDVLVI